MNALQFAEITLMSNNDLQKQNNPELIKLHATNTLLLISISMQFGLLS